MLFSVLIANYNNSRFLDRALDSVFAQTYSNWEIILVDDASTDEFYQVIDRYKNESRLKIYRNERNMGCGFTKRKCAEKASGYILAFLDPDDALVPEALQLMEAAHISNPSCSIIHSTHYICDADLHVRRIAEYPRPLPEDVPYLLLSDGRIHAFASFKKLCYDRTPGISPLHKKAVDQDLYYKLEETGPVLFIDLPLYYYRIHMGAISTSGMESEATLWHYRVIEEACLRRIRRLKANVPGARRWVRKYRTRYHKIRIFRSFREKRWLPFLYHLLAFPFVGGLGNLVNYTLKLPKEGLGLLRRSFVHNYEIK